MTVVVDASLALKWIIDETDSDPARRFFVKHHGEMHAPDLLLIEVAGSLVRRANERKATSYDSIDGVHQIRARLNEAAYLHRVTPELIGVSAELAIALGHPIKDCVYLALADRLGCPLATSDVKFRDRVADPARVKLLAELV